MAAAEALGRFENPDLSGFLFAAMPDADKWVNQALEESLRKCTGTTGDHSESSYGLTAAIETN
jgi:hypothetical protein